MRTRKSDRPRRKPKAATEDVLGEPQHPPRVNHKWRPHYDRLVELRERLVSQQGDLAKDALEEQPAYSSHMADAGTDNYDRDLALSMLSSEQDAVYEIEQAINRIRNGTYGVCELTGKPIERARLEAIPWTRFSTAAERQLEAQGALKRARLSPRESLPKTSPPPEEEE